MSVRMTCLGWHWYPYRYARTVDDGDGRAVGPFPEWLGALGARAVEDARDLDQLVTGTAPVGTGASGDATGPTAYESTAYEPTAYEPDVALVNWYGPGARMGMHADRDERSRAPVVSVSVGDTCVFRFGNPLGRGRPWTDIHLESGDLFVFGGPSRLAYHGVTKVLPGTADPAIGLDGGRFNVTVRQTGLDVPTG